MRYPKHLTEQGTIGFVAPSFGCATEPYRTAFQNCQKVLSEKGHGIVLGPNCYESSGTGISNTPEKCGKELTESYLSQDSQVLISCGGGELMCEILDYVDFEKISKAEPKWYMGYSDNTNFTYLSATICDTAAIYGPCAAAFGMEPWHPAIEDAYDLLRGTKNQVSGYELWEKESLKDEEHPLVPYHVTEPRQIRSFLGDKEIPANQVNFEFSGRLIGGCMDCLVNLLGTEYDKTEAFNKRYQEDGFIWFLESCDLNVFAIRRAVWQMQHAGWFQHVKGFLIGRPYCHGQEIMGLDQYRAVTELLKGYGVPVVMDLDIGHLAPMMPVICGGYAKIQVKDNDIQITYEEK